MRIEFWSIYSDNSLYDAPECRKFSIQGKVYGHSEFKDGKPIRTSDVVNVMGCEVHTQSGSVYTLGEPNPAYVQWCKHNGRHVPTPDQPIKLL